MGRSPHSDRMNNLSSHSMIEGYSAVGLHIMITHDFFLLKHSQKNSQLLNPNTGKYISPCTPLYVLCNHRHDNGQEISSISILKATDGIKMWFSSSQNGMLQNASF